MAIRINQLNESDLSRFVEMLGGVFERSPWVAEQAFILRPYTSRRNLHEVMVNIVRKTPRERRLELLRSYPQLAGEKAAKGLLSLAAKKEQSGAGLNRCSNDELDRIRELNQAYREKFDFPFIIALAGLDKAQIFAAMQQRLQNPADEEFATAVAEVEKIAWTRIASLVNE